MGGEDPYKGSAIKRKKCKRERRTEGEGLGEQIKGAGIVETGTNPAGREGWRGEEQAGVRGRREKKN